MAEIIVEPTALSKVIPLKFKINDVDVPKTTQLSTNKQFNTTDTDAWFTFELDGLASTGGTYDLTLINLDDKSIFHHANVLFQALPFHYKLNSSEDVTLNEIRHAGIWLGQLVVTLSNGDTTARQFGFNIAGHILDGQDAQVILLSDYQALINTINLAKDDLAQYNVDHAALLVDIAAAEDARVTAYNQLLADQQANIEAFDVALDDGIVAANLATKLQDFEATNNSRLLSAEQQLADVAEQLSATNQPIVDTGNYFSADNTNAALQELGAHKASTSNPHGVTKAQVGLGSVDNTSDANKPVSTATQTALNLKANKADVSAPNQPIVDTGNYFSADNTNAALQELGAHKASTSNPHGVTKAQVGLGSVDNTSDANKPVSTATQTALNLKANKADVSAPNQPIVDTGNYFSADNTNAALQELGAHKASTSNPHGVTKAQVGLGSVDNTSDANKPVSTATQTALNLKANKADVSAPNQPIVDTGNYFSADNTNAALQELGAHKASTSNPHGVTKAQVGLGSVDNTSDANKPVSTATQTALNLKANKVQEAWITPTLINGWVAFGGAEDGPTYYKDDFGNVKLRGVVKSGTLSVSMFKLPIGYRPAKNKYFAVISNNVPGFVLIDPSGGVIPLAGTSNVFVALDSISFKVD